MPVSAGKQARHASPAKLACRQELADKGLQTRACRQGLADRGLQTMTDWLPHLTITTIAEMSRLMLQSTPVVGSST